MIGKLKTALCGGAICAGLLAIGGTAEAAPLKIVGPAAASRPVTFDVVLPLRNTKGLEALSKAQQQEGSAQYHKWLTPAQFGERFGPDAATKQRVANFLRSQGFSVRAQTRSLRVSGTADKVARNFGVQLMIAQSTPGTSHIVSEQMPKMPAALASTGAQVFSFIPHVMQTFSHASAHPLPVNARHGDSRLGPDGPYWFDDLKQAYQYPSADPTDPSVQFKGALLNGTGAKIAALMSSDVLDSDMAALFDHEQWSTVSGTPDPTLAGRVYVNGGAPFGNAASFEASLDVQQELTGAPGASVTLYDIPDLSDGNIFAGYVDIDESNAVDVVSSSFGGCELNYFPSYNRGTDYTGILRAYHELFVQGNVQGITFLASSGDSAGLECPTPAYFFGHDGKFVKGIQVPASDPAVTAVGGTNVVTSSNGGATLDAVYESENAWSDPEVPYDPYGVGVTAKGGYWGAGSGESAMWSAPDYQTLVATGSTMRTVPDIGMQVGGCPGGIAKLNRHGCNGGNDPQNGNGNTDRSAAIVAYGVGQGGGYYGVIGTSVSSPEFAGVVAYLVQQHGRQGNLNTYIYTLANTQAGGGRTVYHTAIPGFNGLIDTNVSSTYSLSTGVGTPMVTDFINKPRATPAGTPRTVSNP